MRGIIASNKELAVEVECLRHQLEATNHERTEQEAQNQNLVIQISNKEQERTSKLALYHNECMTRVVALLVITALVQA